MITDELIQYANGKICDINVQRMHQHLKWRKQPTLIKLNYVLLYIYYIF